MKSNGYPDEAVAGIIGNMQRESGVKIDPAIVNHIKCVGIVQWCATRKTALQSTFGSSWSNIDNQIDYVIKELNSMPSLKKYLMEKHTPGEHADKFCNVYEIPGVTECAKSFERLPILLHADILRNILYSGVWSKYEYLQIKKRRTQEKAKKKEHK